MRVGQRTGDQGMAGLVIGDALLFLGVHDAALAFQADGAAFDGLVEVDHVDGVLAAAGGHQGGLVDEVGQVGADRAGRQSGDVPQVDVVGQLDVADVDLAGSPRGRSMSGRSTTTVRSNRPGRSRAGSSVSGRLVAAMMMTPRLESKPSISTRSWLSVCSRSSWPPMAAAAAGLAQGVQLVDEDDARRPALGLGEQIAHPAGPDADEHLDEIGAAHAEERHVGLAGDGLGQQRLAGAGRADQQHALGNAAAQGLVLVRRLRGNRRFRASSAHRLVDAGHVLEGDSQIVLGIELVPAAAEGQRRTAARQPAEQEKAGHHHAESSRVRKEDG